MLYGTFSRSLEIVSLLDGWPTWAAGSSLGLWVCLLSMLFGTEGSVRNPGWGRQTVLRRYRHHFRMMKQHRRLLRRVTAISRRDLRTAWGDLRRQVILRHIVAFSADWKGGRRFAWTRRKRRLCKGHRSEQALLAPEQHCGKLRNMRISR